MNSFFFLCLSNLARKVIGVLSIVSSEITSYSQILLRWKYVATKNWFLPYLDQYLNNPASNDTCDVWQLSNLTDT
jgi:hypothetical protein